ncbi:MAG TPA: putative glycoside hydrolase [Treponemataceae bacterium]|mgnify:FL=1|nr:putative glycoside hydrolase [Treponemataceae bacterium]
MSHPIYGLSYILPDTASPKWIDIEKGFDTLPGNPYVDEIADILPVLEKQDDGTIITKIYLSQTFIPRIYVLDWKNKQGQIIWRGELVNGTIDSLVHDNNTLYFLEMAGFSSFDFTSKQITKKPAAADYWLTLVNKTAKHPQCAFFTQNIGGKTTAVSLTEMWMLYPAEITSPYFSTVNNRKSLYIPSNNVSGAALDKHIKTIKDNGLNSIVVDMKDDHGMIRFNAKTPSIVEKNGISRYAIDLEPFVEKLKNENIYLIARVVVFKDKNLYQYAGGKYAVWDAKLKKPWLGIRNYTDTLDEQGVKTGSTTNYYDEYWVDPYSEEVWAYNVAISQELIARGFDEIQFDYIRFPTDGLNLSDASYRWRDNNMNMESGLISFLRYSRENLKAPIGIDIYGANGWYRSGARTGQDVEMLSHYVDVICPMYYPNHFEQNFLDYAPAAERPYRIYYFGGYRNSLLSRNKVLIRPWVQAFYMNVSYDRIYYNKDYVKREIFGVRDSLNMGYMYWNNIGRYDDISPDISSTEPYPWQY